MKQLTINIEDRKYKFVLELIKGLDFIRIVDEKKSDKKNRDAIIKSIKTGLGEVEKIKKGELKSIPLKDLLNEL